MRAAFMLLITLVATACAYERPPMAPDCVQNGRQQVACSN